MSLSEYQRAVADLVASPELCVHVRAAASTLDSYGLTDRERHRLCEMVGHAGMSHHCTLYRANRVTPLALMLPETCAVLGGALRREVELFWAHATAPDLQFRGEAEAFAAFLRGRAEAGEVAGSVAGVALDEVSRLDARFGTSAH